MPSKRSEPSHQNNPPVRRRFAPQLQLRRTVTVVKQIRSRLETVMCSAAQHYNTVRPNMGCNISRKSPAPQQHSAYKINQSQHNTIRTVLFISGITHNLYSHNVGVVGCPQYYWEGECYIKCQEIVDGGYSVFSQKLKMLNQPSLCLIEGRQCLCVQSN